MFCHQASSICGELSWGARMQDPDDPQEPADQAPLLPDDSIGEAASFGAKQNSSHDRCNTGHVAKGQTAPLGQTASVTASRSSLLRFNGELRANLLVGLYAFVGALIATCIDCGVNPRTNEKVRGAFRVIAVGMHNLLNSDLEVIDTIAFLVIAFAAAIIAVHTKTANRLAALYVGLSIYSVLALPQVEVSSRRVETSISVQTPISSKDAGWQLAARYMPSRSGFYKVQFATGAERNHDSCSHQDYVRGRGACFANAVIDRDDPFLSSCKPSYFGPFGLGSYLNNSLESCPVDSATRREMSGREIRVVDLWRTFPSRYYYVQFQVKTGDHIDTYWTQAGWKDDPFGFLTVRDPAARADPNAITLPRLNGTES